jgi:hypothetical protein
MPVLCQIMYTRQFTVSADHTITVSRQFGKSQGYRLRVPSGGFGHSDIQFLFVQFTIYG